MGPTMINGLPAHVLLVHVVVVLVPLTALALVAGAISARFGKRLGVLLPLLAFVALVSVPLTTHAGEWLKRHMGGDDPLVDKHAALGDTLLPWALGLFVIAAAVWWIGRRASGNPAMALRVVVAVLAIVVSVGSVVQVYRIGDSGARAAWQGQLSGTSSQSGS
jgi:hypothetical protein